MKKHEVKNLFQAFLQEESGQTTTEYILILAVVVTLIMQFKKAFQGFMSNLLQKFQTDAMEAASGDDY